MRQFTESFGGFIADPQPVNRNLITGTDASKAPTALMMDEATAAANARGTWSDLFDTGSFINQNHVATVAVWWLAMVGMGWLSFPLLFALFPALPDRGFTVAKLVGWLLVAWAVWVGATLHLGTWSRTGIALSIALLGVLSGTLGMLQRGALRAYLRAHWRRLAALEGMTLLLFLLFLGVRLGNPDLWHNSFGGEKPMNFAYFNAVLRSEAFPPLDPWFAGGFINYYYWGYVLAGTPVKLLGIVPSLAYNLLIPTLFAFTAMGAFAVAYNLTAAQAARDLPAGDNLRRAPGANPWVAGIAALMMVAVLGNLDTVRVFTFAVAELGGWGGPGSYNLEAERREQLLADFRQEEGREPTAAEAQQLTTQAAEIPLWTQFSHTVTQWSDMSAGFGRGFRRLLDGESLQMHTHRWYWAPTRIIGELPNGQGFNAINEMPYFTFLYGDLHAHMIAMPLMLLVMLWLVAEVLGAGRGLRTGFTAGLALFLGALTVGLLRATNSWDYPTYLILGVVGVTFVAWVGQTRLPARQAPPPLLDRLRQFLDARHALRLWVLLWAVPVGLMLYIGLFLVERNQYNANLQAGRILLQCQNLPEDLPRSDVPPLCVDALEPHFSALSAAVWGVGALGGLVFLYMAGLVFLSARFDQDATLKWVVRLGLFLALGFLATLPYTAFNVGEAGLVPWEKARTPLWAYLDIHGLFLFILGSFLVWQSVRYLRHFRVAELRGLSVPLLLVLFGAPLTLLAALLVGLTAVPVMLVTLPMMAGGMALFLVPGTSNTERLVYLLMVLALGITTGVELVALDVDNGRQNSVFKFYLQAWLLFGVSSGVALAWLLQSVQRWNVVWYALWQLPLVSLVTVAFLYPITATQARWLDRFDGAATGPTLDGLAYMQHGIYGMNGVWFNFRGDYQLIRWMQENLQGTPTIVEAQAVEYQWGSRIANNTGLPTVIGWRFHQSQQRNVLNLGNRIWNRVNNVQAFYTLPDIDVAWDLIQFYGIEYIVVGNLERIQYGDVQENPLTGQFQTGLSAGLAKFDRMAQLGWLEVVYEQPSCIIGAAIPVEECPPERRVQDKLYRVVPGATYATDTQQGGG
ncbi:MAG: hypothetical protein HC915_03975 [Anaerolineae bacterium]|nr:hypothetical protein [Anaerolineae bacterium]